MSSLATAIVGSAVVGAWSSRRAGKEAAAATREGTDAQVAEQRAARQQMREDLEPWRVTGQAANERLMDPGRYFETAPGYEWRRNEGTRDLENRFSVRGGGGNAMRALAEYNQNLASNEFQNWWNRQSSIANRGQAAAAGQAAATGQTAGMITQAYGNQANALANNAWNRYSGINNSLQAGLGNYMYARGRGLLG